MSLSTSARFEVLSAGSVLCGTAQDMPQVVLYRAIQGLGGGGLMVLSQAIIGNLRTEPGDS